MKEIKLNNYYGKLSAVQRKKHAEKQGMLCYYEWYDVLAEECTFEEAGCIFLALLHYDRYGGSVALPDFIEEKLKSDKALKMLFMLCMDKIAAASKEWINKHKLKAVNTDENNINVVSDNQNCKDIEEISDDDLPF